MKAVAHPPPLDPGLEELTAEFLDSYMGDERARRISQRYLPSREAIVEILESVLDLMYPGYFGRRDLSGENLRARDFMLLSVGPQQFLTALVFDGVFERFSALRGGVIELGAGWVPEYLRTLDLSQKIFKRTDASIAELPLKASDYIRRAVKFTPFPGEDVGRMIADAGPDLFLFSSDYPHPEGTDDPIGRFERTFNGISEEAKLKFYSGNFQAMMASTP